MSLIIFLSCGSGLIFTNLYLLSTNLNQSVALKNAALFSDTLMEFRGLYTSEVVSRLDHYGIDVTHDYAMKKGAIPLPATFSIKLGERIREKIPGADVKLFSDHPFPFRQDGGPKDDYEEAALKFLRLDPTKPYARFEEIEGRWSIRYAIPEIMKSGCVVCHNAHPESPKKDWKVGDVRGVLEVILPLEGVKKSTQRGLLGSFLLIGGMTLVGLLFLAIALGGLRRASNKAEMLSRKTVRITEELHQETRKRKQIEAELDERMTELERINTNFQSEISERKQALAESEATRKELEEFNKVAVGRELKMIELKKHINELLEQQGKDKLYTNDTMENG